MPFAGPQFAGLGYLFSILGLSHLSLKEFKTAGWTNYKWPEKSYFVPDLYGQTPFTLAEMYNLSSSAPFRGRYKTTSPDETLAIHLWRCIKQSCDREGESVFLIYKFHAGLYSQIFINSLFSVNFEKLHVDFAIFLSNSKILLIDTESENFYSARETLQKFKQFILRLSLSLDDEIQEDSINLVFLTVNRQETPKALNNSGVICFSQKDQ